MSCAAATEIAPGPSTTAPKTASTTTLRVRILAEEASYADLGVYLSPDPEHRASARMGIGPQAYAYASGRPLVMTDPSGRASVYPNGTHFGSEEHTAVAATLYIFNRLIRSGNNNTGNEWCCTILENECGKSGKTEYEASPFEEGTGADVNFRVCNPSRPSGKKIVGALHTHPSLPNQLRFGGGDIAAADNHLGVDKPVNLWVATPDGGLLWHKAGTGVPGTTRTYSPQEVSMMSTPPVP